MEIPCSFSNATRTKIDRSVGTACTRTRRGPTCKNMCVKIGFFFKTSPVVVVELMKRVEIFAWKRKRTRTYFIVRGCKNIRVTNIFRSLLFFLFFSQSINFIVAFRGSRFVDRSRRKNGKWRRNEIESKNRGERRRIYRGKIVNCSSCNAKKKGHAIPSLNCTRN